MSAKCFGCRSFHRCRDSASGHRLGSDYMSGSPIRQDYLETAIAWLNDGKIEEYMAEHQHDINADDLWLYFQNVMNWVKAKFPKKRKEMKQVAWGVLYNKHKDDKLDAAELEKKIAALMKDSDVQKSRAFMLMYSMAMNITSASAPSTTTPAAKCTNAKTAFTKFAANISK